jgi:hypothetical protein
VERISPVAYQALRDALACAFWFKKNLRVFLRSSLRDQPDLLARLDFDLSKRETADQLISLLVNREDRLRASTIQLMRDLSEKTSFPDIEGLEPADREYRLKQAKEAVAVLLSVIEPYAQDQAAKQASELLLREQAGRQASIRRFSDELAALKGVFLELAQGSDPQRRGLELERLLNDLFALFDLEPRFSYVIGTEQIDGSFRFDTDDYIVEARWRALPTSRGDGDVFAKKVERKGKNALGLFVSVNGFSADFLQEYSTRTPFITLDGGDLMAVLEERMALTELISAKKRHANDTGSCHFPISQVLRAP